MLRRVAHNVPNASPARRRLLCVFHPVNREESKRRRVTKEVLECGWSRRQCFSYISRRDDPLGFFHRRSHRWRGLRLEFSRPEKPEPSFRHLFFADEFAHPPDVRWRPEAAGSAWRKTKHVLLVINAPELSVNPPEAERFLNRVFVCQAFLSGMLLIQDQPRFFLSVVVLRKPRMPRSSRREPK